jgi:predicted nucleic acid-binding Zn ribbon protein
MDDKPLRKCPECGRMQLQKLISAPSFRLKGEGWYETDFKSDKEKKRNIAGDAAEKNSSSEQSSEKKKDSSKSDSGKTSGKTSGKSGSKDAGSAVA